MKVCGGGLFPAVSAAGEMWHSIKSLQCRSGLDLVTAEMGGADLGSGTSMCSNLSFFF